MKIFIQENLQDTLSFLKGVTVYDIQYVYDIQNSLVFMYPEDIQSVIYEIGALINRDNIVFIVVESSNVIPDYLLNKKGIIYIPLMVFLNECGRFMIQNIIKEMSNMITKVLELEDKVFDIAMRSVKVLEQKEAIELVANKDGLTGLFNHSYFHRIVAEKIEEQKRFKNIPPFSIVLIDIDYFKNINDTYGHLCGDYVLKEFANILQKHTRETDIIARYGGEEFAVVLNNTALENAHKYIQKISDVIQDYVFDYLGTQIKLTFSAGVSLYEVNKYNTSADFLGKIDEALYQSKRTGRNKITVVR
jgi:diguanylate cyclase (GGDEF)-like protein